MNECQRPLRREPGLCGLPERHPFHRQDAESYQHPFVGVHSCQANGCRLDAVTEMAFTTSDRRVERRYCADHAESMLRAVAGMPE